MANKKNDFFSNFEELPSRLYIILGILFMAIYTALCAYTKKSPAAIGIFMTLLYAAIVIAIFIFSKFRIASRAAEKAAADEQNSGVISAFRESVDLPYAVITRLGKIVTVNTAMKNISGGRESYFNLSITDLCDLNVDSLIASADEGFFSADAEKTDAETSAPSQSAIFYTFIDGNKFDVSCHPIRSNGHVYYMLLQHVPILSY